MTARLTMPKLLLLLVEIIAFAILGVVASSHFGFGDGMRITLAYLVAYLVPCIVLRNARDTSMAAQVILLVLTVVLMFVGYSSMVVWSSFEGYSLEMPNLTGDARGYYKWALSHYDGRVPTPNLAFPGFPLIMLNLWRVLGVHVVWPLAMNTMFTLTSVVLTGMTCRRLLAHRVSISGATLLSSGMFLMCLLCYYLMIGIAVLKEGSIYLSTSLIGFVLSSMATCDEERHHLWRELLLFFIACLLMAIVRTTYLYFMLVGVVIMALSHWRRDWGVALAMISIIAVAFIAGNYYASYSFERHAEIVGGGWNMQRFFPMDGPQRPYRYMVDYYYLYSPWHKLLLLPLTMSVQFVAPFPWLAAEEPTIANEICRITYGWYLLGCIALFYYLFLSWRRNENLGLWAWWPAISYAVLAYVVAGSVGRYLLPIEPLFIPVILFVLCRLHEGHWRKSFTRWSIFFVILLIITLLVCLELERETFSQALHTRPLLDYLRATFMR